MSDRTHEIPTGWVSASLGDLVAEGGIFTDGDWIETKDQDPNGDVRLIQLADIGEGTFLNRSTRFLTGDTAQKLKCTMLQAGDLLIARMPDPLGRSCIFPGLAQPAVTAVDVSILRPNSDLIRSKWLMWIINSPQVRSRIASMQSGSTRLRISRRNLAAVEILIPPTEEQQRIAEEIEKQLTRIEAATVGLQRAKAKLNSYRAAVLKAAFEGRLTLTKIERPQGERLPSELPKGWVWERVEQLGSVSGGVTQNSKREELPRKLPFLRVANVYAGELSLSDVRTIGLRPSEVDRALLKKNDLLIVEGNGSIEQIGRVALWDDSISPCVHQNHLIKVRLREPQCPKYLLYWLLSPQGRTHIVSAASSTSGLHTLSISKVQALPVPLAPTEEQLQIVSEIERHLSVIEKVEETVAESINKAESLRQSVLRQAFAGGLVPQDSDSESAPIPLESLRRSRVERSLAQAHTWPQKGRGIKPGVSTPGNEPQHSPKPRRGAGNDVRESASAPSGLPHESGGASLGLKPQALRPGPFRAEPTGGDGVTQGRSSPTGKTEEGRDFLGLSREEQIDQVWESLLGLGAVGKDEAVRHAANDLREKELAQFQRLRQGGTLYEAISSALNRGVRAGSFDRPRRGTVRALLPDAREYSPEEWRRCLLGALNNHAIDEEDALRAAAEWARENMGLEFSRLREDGVIVRGLRDALNDAFRRGEIQRKHGQIRVLES